MHKADLEELQICDLTAAEFRKLTRECVTHGVFFGMIGASFFMGAVVLMLRFLV